MSTQMYSATNSLDKQIKYASIGLYAVAGVSVLNVLASMAGSTWSFAFGLAPAFLLAQSAHQSSSSGVKIALFLAAIVVCGVFAVFAFFAGKGAKWAFIAALAVYGVDTAIWTINLETWSALCHLLAIWIVGNQSMAAFVVPNVSIQPQYAAAPTGPIDYAAYGFADLLNLMEKSRNDPALILAFCEKALMDQSPEAQNRGIAAARDNIRLLVEQAEPGRLAALVLRIPQQSLQAPIQVYVRLAARLEQIKANELALHTYWRIYESDPHGQDSERALYRFGQIMESAYGDSQQAIGAYQEQISLFPQGALAAEASRALERLGADATPQAVQAAPAEPAVDSAEEEHVLPPVYNQGKGTSRADFLETGDKM